MNHEEGPCAAQLLVEGIGEADIEGQMMPRVRIELLARYPVEAFGRLPVALGELGPEPARIFAYLISAKEREAAAGLAHPDFKQVLALEDAHISLVAQREAGIGEVGIELRAVENGIGDGAISLPAR